MKKIGIITTSSAGSGTFSCNYGAALQGYALVKQLRLLGKDGNRKVLFNSFLCATLPRKIESRFIENNNRRVNANLPIRWSIAERSLCSA